MSALDRLASYSAKRGNDTKENTSEVFDCTTPEGAYFNRVHNMGYSMYNKKDDGSVKYSELHDCISVVGNQLVNAIAGSGKTTALSLKLIHDIVTGEVTDIKTLANGMQYRVIDKVWVCTFLRSGAEELKESLLGWQRELGYSQTANQINFSTLDAEFKRCLDAMGVKTVIGEPSKLATLLRRAINACNVTRSGYPLNKEDYQIISSIVTYCRGRLDNKKYQHPSMKDYDLMPTIMDMIIDQYATLRRAEGIMDFEEITELLYKFLYITPNPAVQDFVANRYNYIYVDEFQDTSQIQYAILKFYARGKLWINNDGDVHNTDVLYTGQSTKGKIVAVGDVSQCIYSFKGSDNNIIAHQFDKDFVPTFSTLSYNWRCPENILKPIVPSIHKNTDSKNQKIMTLKKGGDFQVVSFRGLKQMSERLIEEIDDDLNNNYKVGILVRTNFDGVIPAMLLEQSNKFNFSVSSENMTLDSPLPSKLVNVSSIFMSGWSNDVKNTLDLLFGRIAPYEIQNLIKVCANNTTNMFKLSEDDLNYSTPHIAPLILQLKQIIFVNGVRNKQMEVEGLKYLYWHLYTKVFSNNSAYAVNARAYISAILQILESRNFQTVYEFREEVDFLTEKLNARIKKDKSQISIVTVHEAKGKEWDSVYIWNDSIGIFPSSKCDLENLSELEEERRVHYIACTRAKEKERIYTLEGQEGMFLQEMDCKATQYIPKIVQKV